MDKSFTSFLRASDWCVSLQDCPRTLQRDEENKERNILCWEHEFMFIWLRFNISLWRKMEMDKMILCKGCVYGMIIFLVYYHGTILRTLLRQEHNGQKCWTMHPSSWCCVAVFDSVFQSVCVCVCVKSVCQCTVKSRSSVWLSAVWYAVSGLCWLTEGSMSHSAAAA